MAATKVDYTPLPVTLPPSFLLSDPEPSQSQSQQEQKPTISAGAQPIPWAQTPIPEYEGLVALTIPSVLSPAECATLISLAESSVIPKNDPNPGVPPESPWRPALVSSGTGYEAPAPGYRESGRIVWDNQEVADRIWARCRLLAPGLADKLLEPPRSRYDDRSKGRWVFSRFNDRMRFLRYEAGQFFKPHTDGAYFYTKDGKEFETRYTVQVYLSDSAAAVSEAETDGTAGGTAGEDACVGGATRFLSRDRKRAYDVDPRAGTALLFQHDGLLHEGARVEAGVKYAVRMDILYEWVPAED
ncbi:hypothetical protein N3K66_005053 [Trichothecium roseum]|uniref:Uncharacterized protein n=1 Tax=Trichothecium roseum TaxID=47278 RepID=A0ACC0V3R5_9HYPO|nr:hypothetical protein N3K66_005053 [Trichothecium roseum]